MAWYDYAKYLGLPGIYYQNRAIYRGYKASRAGKKNADWNRYYTVANSVPIANTFINGLNSLFESNKLQANTGLGIENYNNPATSPTADAGQNFSGLPQKMVGFTKGLDLVYGDPRDVDNSTRRSHAPHGSGWRPRHYSGKRNYRRFRQ